MNITKNELLMEIKSTISSKDAYNKFIRRRTKNDMIEQFLLLRGISFNDLSFMEQCNLKQMNKSDILNYMIHDLKCQAQIR